MRTFDGIEALRAAAGEEIGVSDWHTITQAEIDRFADATGDHQWIHVDPERARESPFGGTIAHGLLTLSLSPRFTDSLFAVTNVGFTLNYGYDKVRFPAPVPVDSRIRMRLAIAAVDDVAGGVQVRLTQTFEIDGGAKPVCVAEALARFSPAARR